MMEDVAATTFIYENEELTPLPEFQGNVSEPLYPAGSIELLVKGVCFLSRDEILDSVLETWAEFVGVATELQAGRSGSWVLDPDIYDRRIIFDLNDEDGVTFVVVSDTGGAGPVMLRLDEFLRPFFTSVVSTLEELARILPPMVGEDSAGSYAIEVAHRAMAQLRAVT